MRSILLQHYRQRPLQTLLFAGLFFRLLSALFSKGYGMFDDHFLVIEAAQSFADGADYNNWLPSNSGAASGHSWFYVGLHYFLFELLNFTGPDDPQWRMYIVRFIHALYSMLVPYLGYRISRKIAGEETALRVCALLCLLFFIPATSVRNLVEWVCVPPLLWASLRLMNYFERDRLSDLAVSAFACGLAMGIRYQVLFFIAGIGLLLLLRKKIKGMLLFGLVFALSFFLTQIADLFLWKQPFAELAEYVRYNFANSTTYFDKPWYQYLFTLAGMLVPPVSLFLLFGYFRHPFRYMEIFLPSLLFFIFHSWFPNKQERFILPFMPFVIIGGCAGWAQVSERISWRKFEQGSWKFFWILNTIALLVLSTTYSKRSIVEATYFLYGQDDYNTFIFDVSHRDEATWPPLYYTGSWKSARVLYKGYTPDSLSRELASVPDSDWPRYLLFFEEESLNERINQFKTSFPSMKLDLVYTGQPSYLDILLHKMNPRNRNQPVYVYRLSRN